MTKSYLPALLFLIITFDFGFHQNKSWAGRIIKVKGKKIYIKLSKKEARKTSKGDRIHILSKSKKKIGSAVIRKIKGRKAIARLKKGRAKKNNLTRLKPRKEKKEKKDFLDVNEVATVEMDESYSDFVMGFMLTGSMAQQFVHRDNGDIDMEGSMLGAKIVLDYPLLRSFGIRTRMGMDLLNTSGTDENGNNSETSINYLNLDILGRIHLIQNNSFGVFLNLGAGIYSPLSSDLGENPALDENSISTTTLFIGGLGLEYKMTNGWRIFLGGDYFYISPSETVETTLFGGKIGLLFPL